jgi:hypothetical protein
VTSEGGSVGGKQPAEARSGGKAAGTVSAKALGQDEVGTSEEQEEKPVWLELSGRRSEQGGEAEAGFGGSSVVAHG